MKNLLLFVALFAPAVAYAEAQPLTSAERAEQVAQQEYRRVHRQHDLKICMQMSSLLQQSFVLAFSLEGQLDISQEEKQKFEAMFKLCNALMLEETEEFNKKYESKLQDITSAQETEKQEVAVHSDLARATK